MRRPLSLLVSRLLACVLLLPVLVGVATPFAKAQSGQDARLAIAAELGEVQRVEQLQRTWRLSLREPGDALEPIRREKPGVDVAAAWRKAVDAAFETQPAGLRIAAFQANALTEAEARAIIAFRRSPLGRKITDAEVISPFPEARMADTAFVMAEIDKARRALDRDKARARILSDILRAAGGDVMQAELMLTLARGFAVGMALAEPQGQTKLDPGELAAFVDRDRPRILKLVRQMAVPTLSIAYRELTQADLQAYLAHLRSPVGRKNIAAVTKAFATTMNALSVDIGRSFAKDLAAPRL